MPKGAPARATRRAYAKINLYLDILACREDGFHELLTVMHALSLHDDVTVRYAPSPVREIKLSVYGARLPLDGRNLAYRAAEAFLVRTGLRARVHITIRKRIPVAGGMAGGSSDAAAVLLACNDVAGRPLTREALLEMAAALGSDVPFCLVGGTQLCRGRGEKMTPLPLAAPLHAVVAVSGERVSTPAAFASADALYHRFDGSVPHGGSFEALCAALAENTLTAAPDRVYNAFEPVVLPTCPAAAALRDRLLALGATSAHVSGSGPSVFGLFESEEKARAAAAALGPLARYATSVPENDL